MRADDAGPGGSVLSDGLAGSLDVEKMKTRVYELNRISAAIHEERRALETRLAQLAAKWKIGQRVLWRERGEYEITHIAAGSGIGKPKYFGRKVLKSGTLGSMTVELWVADYGDSTLRPANVAFSGGPLGDDEANLP